MSRSLYTRLAKRYAPQRFSMSRRQMLQATLAASTGLLMSNCENLRRHFPRGVPLIGKRIIVIGAGFAGLACAYELDAAGYDVTIVEARNRVGGRVVTFKDIAGSRLVEGGGELIGDNHPTWAAYAKKFNLTFRDIPDEQGLEKPLILEGRRIESAEAEKIFRELDATLSKLNAAAAEVNADEPWKTPNAATFDAFTMAGWLDNVRASPLTKRAIRTELEGNESVALEKQSYLAFLTMVKGGGLQDYWDLSETKRCSQGNGALAEAFAKELSNQIRLSTPVVGIAHSSTGVSVTLKNNQVLHANDVVLTVPPSVWGKIKFTPELPAALHVQMGVAVKHLSGLKRRFWKGAGLSAESTTDGDINMTWEGTSGYAGDAPAELTAFSGGPAAVRVRKRSDAERTLLYREQLSQLYPGYAENVDLVRFMDWPADPHTLASYSFAAPGQVTAAGPTLYSGINCLHFAGEGTCFKFCGYMEGGLNSGAGAARRIAIRDRVA